jgi:hypothetical protein
VESGILRNRQFRCHFAAPLGVGLQAVASFWPHWRALVSVADSDFETRQRGRAR